MSGKHPEHEQFELNFGGLEPAVCVDSTDWIDRPLCICTTNTPNEDVVSFADKVAQKTLERDKQLYKSILSRIKHLQF